MQNITLLSIRRVMAPVVSAPEIYIYRGSRIASVRNVPESPGKCASIAASNGRRRHSSAARRRDATRGRDSFSANETEPVAHLIPYLLFLQEGCDEGSRLRGARVAQAPVEEHRERCRFPRESY